MGAAVHFGRLAAAIFYESIKNFLVDGFNITFIKNECQSYFMDIELISFERVMNRFAAALGLTSDKAIADCLGLNPTAYSNRKKSGSIPYKELIDYLCSHKMDIGEMLSPTDDPYKMNFSAVQNMLDQRGSYEASDYVAIPHYNVQAAAGIGVLNSAEEMLKPLSFRYDWLAKRHLSPVNLVIVDVRGDSMEPYLKDGDMVLVDCAQTDVTAGKTYVLRLDGHLLVKNLQLLPQGLIQVCSFNSGYAPYQVDLANEALDMAVIGRVVASMQEW